MSGNGSGDVERRRELEALVDQVMRQAEDYAPSSSERVVADLSALVHVLATLADSVASIAEKGSGVIAWGALSERERRDLEIAGGELATVSAAAERLQKAYRRLAA